jgi:glyoxylase-like metal-dependent hydrolase (beta-lactamase superfamily II)
MAVTVPVNRDYDPAYGAAVTLSPLVTRVLAHNPSPFTFHGTGTYLITGASVAVIDPGPDEDDHLQAILSAAGDKPITHILITHTHMDHSPLAARLKAKTGAKTYGFGPHGRDEERGIKLEEGGDMEFAPDVTVRDGDVIKGDGWTSACVFTPGHTSNHMCFTLEEERAFFPGDHVMGWSTTVVSPPDGDMRAYMASLEKLTHRNDAVYYPTHGAPIGGAHDALARNPQDYVRTLIAHRRDREDQILERLTAGDETIPAMVEVMYAAVDKRLHPAAAHSVFGHLVAMVAEGRIVTDGPASPQGRYRLP